MIYPVKSTHTGIDAAPTIPVGATLDSASWHVALFYGPSLPFDTERDALVAAIDAADEAASNRPGFAPTLTIDLRWNLRWEQGSPDANGRTTHSSGLAFTVHRTTYLTPNDARARLANIDRVAALTPLPGSIPLPPMRNGDTVTVRGEPTTMITP